MGFLRNIRAAFHDDWCGQCKKPMRETRRQLYMLPERVGHYHSHQDAEYFRCNLRKVNRKADIPTGLYACGAVGYQCPECGRHVVKLSIFLPVRDQEKHEDTVRFENGELDDVLWK